MSILLKGGFYRHATFEEFSIRLGCRVLDRGCGSRRWTFLIVTVQIVAIPNSCSFDVFPLKIKCVHFLFFALFELAAQLHATPRCLKSKDCKEKTMFCWTLKWAFYSRCVTWFNESTKTGTIFRNQLNWSDFTCFVTSIVQYVEEETDIQGCKIWSITCTCKNVGVLLIIQL